MATQSVAFLNGVKKIPSPPKTMISPELHQWVRDALENVAWLGFSVTLFTAIESFSRRVVWKSGAVTLASIVVRQLLGIYRPFEGNCRDLFGQLMDRVLLDEEWYDFSLEQPFHKGEHFPYDKVNYGLFMRRVGSQAVHSHYVMVPKGNQSFLIYHNPLQNLFHLAVIKPHNEGHLSIFSDWKGHFVTNVNNIMIGDGVETSPLLYLDPREWGSYQLRNTDGALFNITEAHLRELMEKVFDCNL